MRLIVSRRSVSRGAGFDQPQVGAPGTALLVDNFLRVIEAAAALRFAAEAGISGVDGPGARPGGLSDLILSNAVAAAQNHRAAEYC